MLHCDGGAQLKNGRGRSLHHEVSDSLIDSPLWPKSLPNEGLLGKTIGVSVDAPSLSPPGAPETTTVPMVLARRTQSVATE
jgi:hypothetical protein